MSLNLQSCSCIFYLSYLVLHSFSASLTFFWIKIILYYPLKIILFIPLLLYFSSFTDVVTFTWVNWIVTPLPRQCKHLRTPCLAYKHFFIYFNHVCILIPWDNISLFYTFSIYLDLPAYFTTGVAFNPVSGTEISLTTQMTQHQLF